MSLVECLEEAKKLAEFIRDRAQRNGHTLKYDKHSAVVGLLEQALERLESF